MNRLLAYQRSWWRGDVLAGITVAAYLIPQCMAYGELAGVGSVAGLWAILPPMLIYAVLGSSSQLSIGPESTTAVMTAAAIAPLAMGNPATGATLAAVMALLVGGLCLVGYGARLGFLANLLSKPILVGYMAGVALIMIVSQLGKVTGLKLEAESLLGTVQEFLTHLDAVHPPTVAVAGVVLGFLIVLQQRFRRAPVPLLGVLLATGIVAIFQLDRQGVAVVGEIPAGLPHFVVPQLMVGDWVTLLASAVGIAIVGYSDTVLTARAFAARNRYKIDANQELLALGVANIGNAVFQGFPISSSGSRTLIGDALGSRSQVFSLVAFSILILVLLFFRPILALFPKAALGSIVIFAALRLIDLAEFRRLAHFRRTEFVLAIVTTVGVLLTDLLVGVGVAVALSVVDLFARIARPHDAILGRVEGLAGLHDIDDWEGATTIPGLVIYRYDAPLCFANVEDFKRRALAAVEAEAMPVQWFILSTEAIAEIDITAVDALAELQEALQAKNIRFALARVKQDLYAQLRRSELLALIGADYIFPTLHTAIEQFYQQNEIRE
ncbi:solute carrier family 26 protein [Alkalinema sp. FACHB-956]|uniref:SulP family inorganic anion transporter n=1 Tax=Alkalinema sp. FACHB-956 TaxID=2692768 RepID=UPI0018F05762|nr:solute carrier family 26 protein [Alkalinema sp. FACHB-956]